ncbi:hypothetical protein RI129_006702 [Pyrocoelia pectoralis]|uniref:Ima1 N-terminal domain-containing protein n=1 Tax=Pyrocoelia pectoralis TaxID=417401 RepID=A0AAN7VCX3_9COLE
MDKNSVDIILIFPISLLSFVILLIFVNIFVFIRKKFPINVNCWFCNQWTKVPYHLRDSFECPSCLQYNGFNNDGSYNKLIPAQYDVSLNKSLYKQSSKYSPTNGLCQLCNNNQKLRVFQLANFIPLHEANYDTEIEHFQTQLDKAYKLCNRCENTLQTTIRKQNFLLGISLQKCTSKGLSMMDLTQSTNGISVELKRTYLSIFVYYAIIVFSLLNIGYFLTQNVAFHEQFRLPLSTYLENLYNEYIKKYVISLPRLFEFEAISENAYVSDILVIVEVVWEKIADIFTSFTRALLFSALLKRTQFWLFFVEVLLQFLWLLINRENFRRNVFLLLVSLTMLSLELSYLSFIQVDVDLLSLPISILNILLMWFSHAAIRTKSRKHSLKSLKKKAKHSITKKEIVALPVENNPHAVTKQIVTNVPLHNEKVFNDASTATAKGRIDRPVHMENLLGNNLDLDLSLNKLHIGTLPPRRSPVKTYPCPSPSLERPRPVVSPARFLINTPSTWETSTFATDDPKTNANTFDFIQRNRPFGNFGCNSFYSPPVCNISAQPQFNRHLGSCCPRFSYGDHFNSPYRPLINNEQLVYISPNYLHSGDVYEIVKQNFSSGIFDTGFKENVNKRQYSNKQFENTNAAYNQFTKKFQ